MPETIEVIEYVRHDGDVSCSICGSPLYGKVRKGSELSSYCYRCFGESLRQSIEEMMGVPVDAQTHSLN